jgi:hypothetical protein
MGSMNYKILYDVTTFERTAGYTHSSLVVFSLVVIFLAVGFFVVRKIYRGFSLRGGFSNTNNIIGTLLGPVLVLSCIIFVISQLLPVIYNSDPHRDVISHAIQTGDYRISEGIVTNFEKRAVNRAHGTIQRTNHWLDFSVNAKTGENTNFTIITDEEYRASYGNLDLGKIAELHEGAQVRISYTANDNKKYQNINYNILKLEMAQK